MSAIIPFAKALYLCDGHIGLAGHKTDLMGIFNAIRPPVYPYQHQYFVVFAQLIGGLGAVPFRVDITSPGGQLIRTTKSLTLHFPRRNKLVQLACTIQNCQFTTSGVYLVELFCDGQCVADTSLELL